MGVNINPPIDAHAYEDLRGKISFLTAAATLRVGQNIVYVTANTATDNWTLTLPPVSQAAGQFIFIKATIANSKTVTVQDNNNDAGKGDVALDGDGEYVMLFSTGREWIEVVTGYS